MDRSDRANESTTYQPSGCAFARVGCIALCVLSATIVIGVIAAHTIEPAADRIGGIIGTIVGLVMAIAIYGFGVDEARREARFLAEAEQARIASAARWSAEVEARSFAESKEALIRSAPSLLAHIAEQISVGETAIKDAQDAYIRGAYAIFWRQTDAATAAWSAALGYIRHYDGAASRVGSTFPTFVMRSPTEAANGWVAILRTAETRLPFASFDRNGDRANAAYEATRSLLASLDEANGR